MTQEYVLKPDEETAEGQSQPEERVFKTNLEQFEEAMRLVLAPQVLLTVLGVLALDLAMVFVAAAFV